MILPDVNVLVYAFDRDAPQHDAYARWLTETLGGNEDVALVDAVLAGFVRIVTHPKIMPKPAPTGRALEFVQVLMEAPPSRWLGGSRALWRAFADLAAEDSGIRGNLVPDAYLAAAACVHGARVATADRGFGRFSGMLSFDPVG